MKLRFLLCPFWGHKWVVFKEQVIKTDIQDTANYQEICSRCGEIMEPYGITHLGPFSFSIEENTKK